MQLNVFNNKLRHPFLEIKIANIAPSIFIYSSWNHTKTSQSDTKGSPK